MAKTFQSPISEHGKVRVKVDESLMSDIIAADTCTEVQEMDKRLERIYEHNCNRRELKLYNLLRKMVQDFNSELSTTRIKMRLIEEGQGMYIEMDI